jgi:hypothetical protein
MGVAVAATAIAGAICLAVPAAADASGTSGLGRAQTNRYNAEGCQQDGFQTRVEAETESAFKNAGACTSHTARRGTLRAGDGQVTFPSTPTYPCPAPETGNCWGNLQMSGVPTHTFALITMSGDNDWDGIVIRPDADGDHSGNANVPCSLGASPGVTFSAALLPNGAPTPPVSPPPNCR